VTILTTEINRSQPQEEPKVLILETQGLTRRFGKLTAVNNLSISVEQGEVFGLLGPNGAGKSTVIKMLTTLLPISAGKATLAGYDVARESNPVRRAIGYVPQAPSADGSLTDYVAPCC
jgi:ABC-2 type transport system ATP-binding protein